MASLLEKAKSGAPVYEKNLSQNSDEMVDLAIAYAKHEVTAVQAAVALFGEDALKTKRSATISKTTQSIYSAFVNAVRDGRLVRAS